MKQLTAKKQTILGVASILIVVALGAYSIMLQIKLSDETQTNTVLNAALRQKNLEDDTTANYVDTICAEYRKLYQSDRQLRYGDQPGVDKYIGLPGSATGNIDKCYLSEQ